MHIFVVNFRICKWAPFVCETANCAFHGFGESICRELLLPILRVNVLFDENDD